MTTLVRGVRWVAAACLFAVGAPIALLLLILYLGVAVVVGLLLSVFFVMILAGFLGPVSTPVQWAVAIPVVAGCALLGGWLWSEKLGLRPLFRRSAGDSHGSARLANAREIAALVRVGDAGLLIGRDPKTKKLLGYDGPAHLLTLAPTRAGNGVGTVIPNLLLAYRSMLVIGPEGRERPRRRHRERELQPARPADPRQPRPRRGSEHAGGRPGDGPARPGAGGALERGGPGADRRADPVPRRPRGSGAPDPRHGAGVPDPAARALPRAPRADAGEPRRRRADRSDRDRFLGKADREAAGVLFGAQRHTHFLDSPRIAASLARSDFRFADLRHALTTVFLGLPPNRMDAYSRWLRLLVSEALQDIARDAEAAGAPQRAAEALPRPESRQEAAGAPEASTSEPP